MKDQEAQILRLIDANLNRTKEGLRVCEDIFRFIKNDEHLSKRFKVLRHSFKDIGKAFDITNLIAVRDIMEDVGKGSTRSELKRENINDVLLANMQRVKESIRVLEEFAKVIKPKVAGAIKGLRYKVYAIEKDAVTKI